MYCTFYLLDLFSFLVVIILMKKWHAPLFNLADFGVKPIDYVKYVLRNLIDPEPQML